MQRPAKVLGDAPGHISLKSSMGGEQRRDRGRADKITSRVVVPQKKGLVHDPRPLTQILDLMVPIPRLVSYILLRSADFNRCRETSALQKLHVATSGESAERCCPHLCTAKEREKTTRPSVLAPGRPREGCGLEKKNLWSLHIQKENRVSTARESPQTKTENVKAVACSPQAGVAATGNSRTPDGC